MAMPFKPRPAGRKAGIVAAIENTPAATSAALALRFGVSRERVRQIRVDGGLAMRPRGRPHAGEVTEERDING